MSSKKKFRGFLLPKVKRPQSRDFQKDLDTKAGQVPHKKTYLYPSNNNLENNKTQSYEGLYKNLVWISNKYYCSFSIIVHRLATLSLD